MFDVKDVFTFPTVHELATHICERRRREGSRI
jgi:hypothetical protein